MRPLAVDLCSGLGGWAEGLEATGWDVIRVDIADMFAATGTPKPRGCLLMLQDILTFHGAQAKGCRLIVASPPCTEYSWMAMPWSRAKQVGRALRGEDEFPPSYRGSRTIEQLNALFNACFRIQREACEAAGRHIPLVVENVRGAIPWIGRSRWSFGSFHLWGDVPALMPSPQKGGVKVGGMGWYPPDDPRHTPGAAFNPAAQGKAFAEAREARKNGELGGGSWFNIGSPGQTNVGANPDGRKVPGFRFDGSGRSFQSASVESGRKAPEGTQWFNDGPRTPDSLASSGSKSPARKAASARIAKIPLALSRHIGKVYLPTNTGHLLWGEG